MSLKEKVDSIRARRRPGTFLFEGTTTLDAVTNLLLYIDELEAAAAAPKKAPAKRAYAKRKS